MDDSPKTGATPDPTISDVFPPWKDWSDRFTKFFSFLRTRRAVIDGTPLWEMEKEELASDCYLEPWAFNLYQSFLSAMPSAALVFVLHFLEITTIEDLELRGYRTDLSGDAFSYLEKIFPYLRTLSVPLTLFIACAAAGWATLNACDRSKVSVRRARRAYLYLDGAYGLWPQATTALAQGVMYSGLSAFRWGVVMQYLLAALFFAGSWHAIWQYQLTRWKIPKALFAINGYSVTYPKSWDTFRRGIEPSMWRRCYIWNICVLIAGLLLLETAVHGIATLTAVTASFTHSYVQGWVK